MKKKFFTKATVLRAAAGTSLLALLFVSSAQKSGAHTAYFNWRQDADYYYIDANGMGTHKMMVGITAWQQQVPIPQPFTGDNAFRIPKHPIPAEHPVNVRTALYSGAIAVAVNGVPIFNVIKNDGKTDTFVAGELDDFGGHCGRADDYHYHMPPSFLIDTVGKENPVAYGLDGYPIYGFTEPDGSAVTGLDDLNGHEKGGSYHYHSTKTFPYLNGGEHGIVKVQKDAIVPQPFTSGIRHWLMPLRGAKIVGFTWPGPNKYSLDYAVENKHGYVNYEQNADGSWTFNFIDVDGKKTSETYTQAKMRLSGYLNANNGGNVKVAAGQDVLFAWGNTMAKTASTSVQVYKSTNNEKPDNPVANDGCGITSGPYAAISGKFGAAHIPAKACQAGYTYKYTITLSDGEKTVSDDAIVTVTK